MRHLHGFAFISIAFIWLRHDMATLSPLLGLCEGIRRWLVVPLTQLPKASNANIISCAVSLDKIWTNSRIAIILMTLLWWHIDHYVHAPSQRQTMLHCNVVFHWLGSYTKWSPMTGLYLVRSVGNSSNGYTMRRLVVLATWCWYWSTFPTRNIPGPMNSMATSPRCLGYERF